MKLQKIEEARREHLLQLSDDHRKAESIRSFADSLKISENVGNDLNDWITWAKQVADEIDAINNRKNILIQDKKLLTTLSPLKRGYRITI